MMRTRGRWVRFGSSCSLACTLGVAEFVRIRLVRPAAQRASLGSFRFCLIAVGAPWVSLVSFWFVWFVGVQPGGCLFRLGSTPSFWSALGATGFIWVCLVRLGAPWWSLCPFGFVLFVWMISGGRLVRSSLFASSDCAMGVAGFIRVRLVCPRQGVARFVLLRSEASWCRCVRSGSSGLFGCAQGVSVFVWVRLVRMDAP